MDSDRCLWHPSFNEGTTSSITALELQTKESCEPGSSLRRGQRMTLGAILTGTLKDPRTIIFKAECSKK